MARHRLSSDSATSGIARIDGPKFGVGAEKAEMPTISRTAKVA